MIEQRGDLWSAKFPDGSWIVVPTNGVVKANKHAVMGAGVAKRAAQLMPDAPRVLGQKIATHGNVTHLLGEFTVDGARRAMIAFPTKNHFSQMSELALIRLSAERLSDLVLRYMPPLVVLPRVGTGLGGLGWSVVKPVLDDVLRDGIYVVVTQ